MDTFYKLLFLCPALFAAGLVDGVAGGGGIISLPSYIFAGLPLNVAYGCNKMQSCFGTASALVQYAKNGLVDVKTALLASITALLGAHFSTQIMLSLNEATIKTIIAVCMCFILGLTCLIGRMKGGERTKADTGVTTVLLCLALGITVGLYDGFFGPGGGTVALMLFVLFFSYDIRVGSGNGKIVVVCSNLVALVEYIIDGSVWYEIAIPATIANMLGCHIGAKLAVKKGKTLVKKVLVFVVVFVVISGIIKIA